MARQSTKCLCGCGQASGETCRMRKAECRWCGYTIRVSRRHMVRGLPECVCGQGPLEPRCLEDRYVAGEEAALEAIMGKVRMSPKYVSFARPQDRCGACHKFVKSSRDECEHCGYHPTRGYADAMPF